MRWSRLVVSAGLVLGLAVGSAFFAAGCSEEPKSTPGQAEAIPDTQKAMMDYMQTKSKTTKKHR